MVTKDDIRNALLERHGEEMFRRFDNAVVAICGLGGLSSNVAIALARAGVGHLILIDFDKVDVSNLNRQQYKTAQVGLYKSEALKENLAEINPCVEVRSFTEYITPDNACELLHSAGIICEAFDKAENKAMLLDTVCEKMPDKYLVTASGLAGLKSPNDFKTRKLTSRIYLCGDMKSGVEDGSTLFSSGAMLCASHEAQTILRILNNQFNL